MQANLAVIMVFLRGKFASRGHTGQSTQSYTYACMHVLAIQRILTVQRVLDPTRQGKQVSFPSSSPLLGSCHSRLRSRCRTI